MANALQCPVCGASQTLRNPGILAVSCDYCDTTLYREDDVLRAGEKSIVGEPPGKVFVGAEGRVAGERVTIVGRVQLRHARGTWEEWYGETATGKAIWLVEDGREYTLEHEVDDARGLHAGLKLGDVVQVDGVRYQVD